MWKYMMDILKIIEKYHPAQDPRELEKVINYIIPRKPKIILEIGVYQCGLSNVLYEVFQPEILIGIDDTNEPFKHKHCGILLCPMDSGSSETYNRLVDVLDGRKIDLLIIDGDHRFNGVKKDFELYKSLINVNSCIMFHDICVSNDNPSFCEVQKYWKEEIRDNYDCLEFMHSVGTGLVFL